MILMKYIVVTLLAVFLVSCTGWNTNETTGTTTEDDANFIVLPDEDMEDEEFDDEEFDDEDE